MRVVHDIQHGGDEYVSVTLPTGWFVTLDANGDISIGGIKRANVYELNGVSNQEFSLEMGWDDI